MYCVPPPAPAAAAAGLRCTCALARTALCSSCHSCSRSPIYFLRNCAVLQSCAPCLALLALQGQAHSRSSPVPCTWRCACDLARSVLTHAPCTAPCAFCGTSCAVDRLPLAMNHAAGTTIHGRFCIVLLRVFGGCPCVARNDAGTGFGASSRHHSDLEPGRVGTPRIDSLFTVRLRALQRHWGEPRREEQADRLCEELRGLQLLRHHGCHCCHRTEQKGRRRRWRLRWRRT